MFPGISAHYFIVGALAAQITPKEVKATDTSCLDLHSTCKLLDPIFCDGDYYDWAIVNCPRTCNLCAPIPPTTKPAAAKPVAPVKYCMHGGRNYTQGQTWYDGCAAAYTCVNAEQGTITSRSVCLIWSNLPSVCHIEEAPPGLCCEQPRCPPEIIVAIPKDYEIAYPPIRISDIFG